MTTQQAGESLLALLRDGEITLEGRLVDASNATLFGTVARGNDVAHVVYKPIRGERPLWDFPDGTLAGREVASYLVSDATGWNIVPPTVMRDGPFGPGMVQAWIDVDEDVDLMELVHRPDDPALRRIALLDAVLNNADRKGGHLLPLPTGHVHGCDHGLTFSTEDKLRTVLWQWRGCRLEDGEREVLVRLRAGLSGELGGRLVDYVSDVEVAVTLDRVEHLLAHDAFPHPREDGPAIPWPPF